MVRRASSSSVVRLLLTGISVGAAVGVLYSLALGYRPRHFRHHLLPSIRKFHPHTHDFEKATAHPEEEPGGAAARGGGAGGGAASVPRLGRPWGGGETEESSLDDPSGASSGVAGRREEAHPSAGPGRQEPSETTPQADEAPPPRTPLPRVCGSPAVDGYAHVNPKCLEASPTNKLWWQTHPNGGKSGEGLECNIEHAVSLDGLAVGWGIGNTKKSPEECCQACRDHVPGPHVGGPFGNLPCNVWVFCSAPTCYEADAHKHTQGDCWLKFSEAPQNPEVNARGDFPQDFRQRHPDAPARCQWVSGVLLPPGQTLTNGTWGPRFHW